MKRIFLVLILLAFMPFTSVLHAQAPQAVTLQSVLRDAAGRLIANRNVSVLISLRRGSNTGPVVYSETHTPTTNQNGLYTVFFGRGFPVTGTFASIDWSQGPYYATVEADPNGGSNYTLTVSHPIVSVPYALYADQTTESQVLSLSNDTIYLTGGGIPRSYVKIPGLGGSNCYASCAGLDSVNHLLDSIINHPCHTRVGTLTATACDVYAWDANGENYTQSGVYQNYISRGAHDGCDSITQLFLTIKHTTNVKTSENASSYYYWAKHNRTYTSSGNYGVSYTNAEGCPSVDSLYLNVLSVGTMPGVFSVSATKKVMFSKGNLQFKASTRQWRFANNQWEYIGNNGSTGGNVSGNTNANISSTYSGWIDLFGWGTSGVRADDLNYYPEPWSTSDATVNTTYNYYGYGPSSNYNGGNLTDGNSTSDWGMANRILNGGYTTGIWRVLTADEWYYLLYTRSGTRYCYATVCGVKGLVLFPDGYIHTTDANIAPALNSTNSRSSNMGANTFDEFTWPYMEGTGCIFLPMAGYRYGTSYNYSTSSNATYYGRYWTSTMYDARYAWCLQFRYYTTSSSDNLYWPKRSSTEVPSRIYKYYGCSVRLVQDIQ